MKIYLQSFRRKRRDLLKVPRLEFKVNRSFETKSKITKRTLAVSEAFGIGVDETRKFPVFSDFQVEIKPGQVVLITGDSGSGKSTLLEEVSSQISKFGKSEYPNGVISNSAHSLSIDPNEILIEGVGKDVSEAISILSMAGLNEAFLMLRRFRELSDGQKYRYRLAKMIDSKADVWVFDEFGAVLDRTTAKVVSYTLQKTARKLRKMVVAATTHEDLLLDLKPDIWVEKKFGDTVRSTTFKEGSFGKECTLLKDVVVSECSHSEIKELEKFHYRGSNVGIIRKCFKATIRGELVAGVTFVYGHFALRARNIALPIFSGKSTSEKVRFLNSKLARISRVVVSPKYRSIGLGAFIVKETLPLCGFDYVETLAVMARYNTFFESAGMIPVELEEDKKFLAAISRLEASTNLRRELLASKRLNLKILSKMSKKQLIIAKEFALDFCVAKKFRKTALIPKVEVLDRESIAEALSLVRGNPLYLYWKNPNMQTQL